jgi:type VI secretion system protein ImpM
MRPPEDRIALDHLEIWYEHLGRAAMQTLGDERASIDHLEAALHDAPAWPAANRGGAWPLPADDTTERWRGNRQLPLTNWMHTMAVGQLARHLHGHSLWWRGGKDSEGDTLDIVHGLPAGRQFVALIEPSTPG